MAVEVTSNGRSEAASLRDLSEVGCCAVGNSAYQVGQHVEIALQALGKRLQGRVAASSDQGAHIHFTDAGLSTADVDRISLETVGDLVQVAKNDHVAFVKRVNDIMTSGQVPHEGLATHHTCRLGRWYDSLSDAATLALPSYRAIAEPHYAVHACGHKVLEAISAHDTEAAQRHLGELRQHSERVMRCLDEFGREYPATVTHEPDQVDRAA